MKFQLPREVVLKQKEALNQESKRDDTGAATDIMKQELHKEATQEKPKKSRKVIIWIALAGIAAIIYLFSTPAGSDITTGSTSAVSGSPLSKKKDIVMAAPNWNGSVLTGDGGDTFTLTQVSCKMNKVLDTDKWFENNGLAAEYVSLNLNNDNLSAWPNRCNGKTIFVVEGCDTDKWAAYYGNNFAELYHLAITDTQSKVLIRIDFSKFTKSPYTNPGDEMFVFQSIRNAHIEGNILYINHGHRTYAHSSGGQNAYISAIDLSTGEILWTTEPLTCNSSFIIVDNTIICGYGFTDEDDFVYLVDKTTGRRRQTIKVASGPEIILRKDNKIYVRTYNRDYVFNIAS